jgi:hypothetical protein
VENTWVILPNVHIDNLMYACMYITVFVPLRREERPVVSSTILMEM